MPDSYPKENDFLRKIKEIVEDNLSNEQFGVSELADRIGMSRSNLLRKVKKITDQSVSRYIREIRVQNAFELLKDGTFNVSEVAFKVGFSSTSYFIKCFREYYGYSPGETASFAATNTIVDQNDRSSQKHRLSAIMFTDIQGYTALMQQDEVTAVSFRNRHREVFNATIKKYGGKILQYYGDGTLSTFTSAIDAVRCAIDMQRAFQSEPNIPVRIGIHSGDIIFTKDDIIGDGVNVASRVESLAIVGSVFISDKVYDEIKNQPDIKTKSMGIFGLKNVNKPMEVFAIANPGLSIPNKSQIKGKVKSGSIGGMRVLKTNYKVSGLLGLVISLTVVVIFVLTLKNQIFDQSDRQAIDPSLIKKSIAVLPFINDSPDSSNIYIVNGLMESILNNLQKIEDLRVISRTSVEKYRNTPKLIPELARELNVGYIVEGSGQKIGDQILLNIQLIDASTDKHLWSEQFNRETTDIFKLQMDVAKNIADKIQVIITPEEEKRIEKVPTDNLAAYDHFLKGLDYFYQGNAEGLRKAIHYFKTAVKMDNTFARAYADIALSYYYLDFLQADKIYTDSINYFSDKAMLYDPDLSQSLVSRAFFYMYTREYDLAAPYLERAHEYHPNSAFVINTLADLYANYSPNTKKYLKYAVRGIQLDIAAHDSTTTSVMYLHLANAFIQSGFVEEAEKYINKSLDYNQENLYSIYLKAYILYAKDPDLEKLKDRLLAALEMDTTRLDIVQEIAKTYYYLRDFEKAYAYYKAFYEAREANNLAIYPGEDSKIGLVYAKAGKLKKSEAIFEKYKQYAERDKSIYSDLSLAVYYAYMDDKEKAIEHFRLFSNHDSYHYWILLFLEMDPLVNNIKDLPEFREIMKTLNTNFWDYHEEIKATLKEEHLI